MPFILGIFDSSITESIMRSISTGILLAILFATGSCGDPELNTENSEKMKDSIFKAFPTVNYTRIEIEDFRNVTVVVGDKELFNGTEEERQAVSNQLADMTIHYFKENNYLNKGTVEFVANETTVPTDNDEMKSYDMHLKDLLKEE